MFRHLVIRQRLRRRTNLRRAPRRLAIDSMIAEVNWLDSRTKGHLADLLPKAHQVHLRALPGRTRERHTSISLKYLCSHNLYYVK